MAFRILSEEEVSLLDEEQRKQYEKELRIYRQRAAYEKVRIPPYEPDLKPITVMKKFEVKPYTRPEYTVAEYKPVEKPELPIKPFKPAETGNPVLPEISKPVSTDISPVKKVENVETELQTVDKPVIPKLRFEKLEGEYPDLPVIPKINVVNKSYKGTREVKVNLPEVVKPEIQAGFSFKTPGFDSSLLRRKNLCLICRR